MSVRAPAMAGRFYPDDPDECRAAVDDYLAEPESPPSTAPRAAPHAVIVPHAGFVYSGPVAGRAYARLRGSTATRVVLLGPAHTVPLRAMAVSGADSWLTPLGSVPIDTELRQLCRSCEGVTIDDRPHLHEHALEVQVPFLQRTLGGLTLLPVVVGAVGEQLVDALIEQVWELDDVVVVVSTDLSHYHDYETARKTDARTARAVGAAAFEAIAPTDACGAFPLRGLLSVARRRGLDIEQIDLCNSGDTAGSRNRVVGYGAWAVTEPRR